MEKIILKPTPEQRDILNATMDYCRIVYNKILDYRRTFDISFKESLRVLTEFKKQTGMRAVDSNALQQAVWELDQKYQLFFSKSGTYPQYAKRWDSYRTFNRNNSIRIVDGMLRLPKVGFIRIEPSLDIKDIISVTVCRKGKESFFAFLKQRNN